MSRCGRHVSTWNHTGGESLMAEMYFEVSENHVVRAWCMLIMILKLLASHVFPMNIPVLRESCVR